MLYGICVSLDAARCRCNLQLKCARDALPALALLRELLEN